MLHTGGWNISITQVDQAKDLCIQMDNVVNFKPQRIAEIAKTRKSPGGYLSVFTTRDMRTLRTLEDVDTATSRLLLTFVVSYR